MNALIIFVSFLMYATGGVTVFIFLALFLAVLAVVSFKAFRLLIALFNASIAESEAAMVRKVQTLNINSAKKATRKKVKGEGLRVNENKNSPPQGSGKKGETPKEKKAKVKSKK